MALEYAVGIPVRNEEKTIIQTLTSVLGQTIQPRVIHVCVNGSTDSTTKRVLDMAAVEKNINLIESAPGKANAWNRIVSECLENVVMFCDGDVVVNPEAAENMGNKLRENERLVLVGGSNGYFTGDEATFFSRFCTEDLGGRPIKQDWVCGRLYMAKIKELHELARRLEIELMPPDIINEDGFLEMLTTGYREIIASAYNLSTQVSTFHDWKIGLKRVLAGQKQLKQRYPHLYGDSDSSMKRLKNYFNRFWEIEGFGKKIGVTSLFVLRTALNVYYKTFGGLDYSPIWKETESTKRKLEKY